MESTGAGGEGAGQLWLMGLLEGFVGERGRMEATKVLGGAIDSGRITPRLCDALGRFCRRGRAPRQEAWRNWSGG